MSATGHAIPNTLTVTPTQPYQATAISTQDSSQTTLPDDNFTLYDLRVEAVCPPGQRILCGAKEGDYFTLEGEMMYLPPGQGISIYSLGAYLLCRRPLSSLFMLHILRSTHLNIGFGHDGQC